MPVRLTPPGLFWIFLVPTTFISVPVISAWVCIFFRPKSSRTCPSMVMNALPAEPWTVSFSKRKLLLPILTSLSGNGDGHIDLLHRVRQAEGQIDHQTISRFTLQHLHVLPCRTLAQAASGVHV